MDASLLDPVMAHIVVQYERHATERYDMLITPSPAGKTFVRLRSPVVGVSCCQLESWPGQAREGVSTRAIRSVIGCFFGEVDAKPRIVGTPDWKEVSLEVSVVRASRPNRLLLLSVVAEAPTLGTCSHSNGARVLRNDAVKLKPEDADAVYAVTRLALASVSLAAAAEAIEVGPELVPPPLTVVRPLPVRPVAIAAVA